MEKVSDPQRVLIKGNWDTVVRGLNSGNGSNGRAPISSPRRRSEPKKFVWAKDEHDRFVAALKRYGRDWKAIEHAVGTRTAVQIRSHAQKYFIKLKRHNLSEFDALPPPRKKRSHDQLFSDDSEGHSSQDLVNKSAEEQGLEANGCAGSPCMIDGQNGMDALSLLVTAAHRIDRQKHEISTSSRSPEEPGFDRLVSHWNCWSRTAN